jgi:luciferase family oxidoreductase group 1
VPIPLSVLDLSPIASGSTAGDALRASIDLAVHAEALGFARYWVAEHHNAGGLASSAPELLIGQIAAATRTIRVGAGGIMLPNHVPLRVAELFRVLHALFPGRIDLGLGRAAGTDPRTARALRRGALGGDDFPQQVDELLAYFGDDGTPRPAFDPSIRAIPTGVPAPETWILGSSDYGATYAAAHGLPFAFAHHINPVDAARVLRMYRARFRPSPLREVPRAMLAVSAVCAEAGEEARDVAACSDLALLNFARGLRDLPLPSPEEARAHAWDDEDRALVDAHRGRVAIGTAPAVAASLRALCEEAGADELMVMTHAHEPQVRKRSYALLAAAWA